jgi:HSP20 family protein
MTAAIATKKPETQMAQTGRDRSLLPLGGEFPLVINRMREMFDRWFDRFTPDWANLWEAGGNGWRWGLDLEDKEDSLVLQAEAPGFEAGDFDLQVEDQRLVLRASRQSETKEKESKVLREQECYQSITLPCGINKDKIEATYHNGILTVTMPKTAESKGRKVTVKAK